MTKRNPGLPRNPRDNYPTPAKAVEPVVEWLCEDGKLFAEPCAGEGQLISHLQHYDFYCVDYEKTDALKWTCAKKADFICTNPPWGRKLMHEMLLHFVRQDKPVWLLLDADWMHTKQAAPYIGLYCTHIVSIGRVRWMEGTAMDGYDNAAWYRFRLNKSYEYPAFIPRKL